MHVSAYWRKAVEEAQSAFNAFSRFFGPWQVHLYLQLYLRVIEARQPVRLKEHMCLHGFAVSRWHANKELFDLADLFQ